MAKRPAVKVLEGEDPEEAGVEGEAPDGKALVEEMGATKGAIVPPVCGRRKGHAGLEDTGVDIFRYLVFLYSVVVCCCFLSQVSKTIPFSPLSANIFYYSPPPPPLFALVSVPATREYGGSQGQGKSC